MVWGQTLAVTVMDYVISATLWGCSYWTQEHVGETQLCSGVIELLYFSALRCAQPVFLSWGCSSLSSDSMSLLHLGQNIFMKEHQIYQLLAVMLCCVLGVKSGGGWCSAPRPTEPGTQAALPGGVGPGAAYSKCSDERLNKGHTGSAYKDFILFLKQV